MAIRDTLARLFGAKASILGLPADEIPDRPLEKAWDDATLLSTFGDDAWPYIVGNKVGEQASQRRCKSAPGRSSTTGSS